MYHTYDMMPAEGYCELRQAVIFIYLPRISTFSCDFEIQHLQIATHPLYFNKRDALGAMNVTQGIMSQHSTSNYRAIKGDSSTRPFCRGLPHAAATLPAVLATSGHVLKQGPARENGNGRAGKKFLAQNILWMNTSSYHWARVATISSTMHCWCKYMRYQLCHKMLRLMLSHPPTM